MSKLNKLFQSLTGKPVSNRDKLLEKVNSNNEKDVKNFINSHTEEEIKSFINEDPLQNGQTLLNIAIEQGSLEIVKSLLDAGASDDVKGFAKYSPLMNAILANKLDIAKELVDREENINITNNSGKTPLDILKLLPFPNESKEGRMKEGLIAAIKSKLQQSEKNTKSVDNKSEAKVEEPYIDNTNDVPAPEAPKAPPPPISAYNSSTIELFSNITKGDTSAISNIPPNAKFINQQGPDGNTPLTLAIQEEKLDIAWQLLDLGAKPNIKNAMGDTPLGLLSKKSTEPGIGQKLLARMTPPPPPPSIPTKKQLDYLAAGRTENSSTSKQNTSLEQILQDYGYPESKQSPKEQPAEKPAEEVEANDEKPRILTPPPPVSASTLNIKNNSPETTKPTNTYDANEENDLDNNKENNANSSNIPEMPSGQVKANDERPRILTPPPLVSESTRSLETTDDNTAKNENSSNTPGI